MQKKISLTIIIPVYNEEKRINFAIQSLNKYKPIKGLIIKEIKFVDDGSKDKTVQILRNSKFKLPTKILSYTRNKGRGYAVKKGMENIKTDYAMYIDCDMSIPLNNLETFFEYMKNGTDVLVGSKKIKGATCIKERSLFRKIAGIGHGLLFSAILGIWIHDFQGGFKVFSKRAVNKIFPKLTLTRWSMDSEIIFVADKKGFSVKELPVIWSSVDGSTVISPLKEIILALKDLASIIFNYLRGKYD